MTIAIRMSIKGQCAWNITINGIYQFNQFLDKTRLRFTSKNAYFSFGIANIVQSATEKKITIVKRDRCTQHASDQLGQSKYTDACDCMRHVSAAWLLPIKQLNEQHFCVLPSEICNWPKGERFCWTFHMSNRLFYDRLIRRTTIERVFGFENVFLQRIGHYSWWILIRLHSK